jgi:hypothetical protein
MELNTCRFRNHISLANLLIILCLIGIVIECFVFIDSGKYLVLGAVLSFGIALIFSIQARKRYVRLEWATHTHGRRSKKAFKVVLIAVVFFIFSIAFKVISFAGEIMDYFTTQSPASAPEVFPTENSPSSPTSVTNPTDEQLILPTEEVLP